MTASRRRYLPLTVWLCTGFALSTATVAAAQESDELSAPTVVPDAPAVDDADRVDAPAPIDAQSDERAQVAPPPTEESFQYALAWQQLVDNDEHAAAASLAQTWVNDAIVQYGKRSAETFLPLTRLAQSYAADRQTTQAAQTFAEAITVGERRFGVFSPSLVEPLTGLGTVLSEDQEHEGAVSALLRAKGITHRNLGIYNAEQGPIVDRLTRSLVRLGEVRQATREQRLLFGTQERLVGADSVEFVPALQKWAQWNAQIQRFTEARKYFYEAVDLLEKTYGPNDLRIIETLNMIADSFYQNRATSFPREGARALRRAVEIYKAQDTVDQTDLLRAQSALGDWYMRSTRRSQGVETYKQAIRDAREAGVSDEVINARFGIPRPLPSNQDMPIGMWRAEQARVARANGTVTLEFDVDERGKPRNIRVVEDTVNLVKVLKLARQRLANTVYRPRFVDGEPVPMRGIRLVYEFEGLKE